MDDYFDSFNNQSEAMEISQQGMTALKEGGFRLTKWTSNDSQILDTLPLSEPSSASISLDLDASIRHTIDSQDGYSADQSFR